MISLLGNPSSVACSTSRLCKGNLLPRLSAWNSVHAIPLELQHRVSSPRIFFGSCLVTVCLETQDGNIILAEITRQTSSNFYFFRIQLGELH